MLATMVDKGSLLVTMGGHHRSQLLASLLVGHAGCWWSFGFSVDHKIFWRRAETAHWISSNKRKHWIFSNVHELHKLLLNVLLNCDHLDVILQGCCWVLSRMILPGKQFQDTALLFRLVSMSAFRTNHPAFFHRYKTLQNPWGATSGASQKPWTLKTHQPSSFSMVPILRDIQHDPK